MKTYNRPTIAQQNQRHRFTVIGRTASIATLIRTLVNDRSISSGPYKKHLALALLNIEKANDLVREVEIDVGVL